MPLRYEGRITKLLILHPSTFVFWKADLFPNGIVDPKSIHFTYIAKACFNGYAIDLICASYAVIYWVFVILISATGNVFDSFVLAFSRADAGTYIAGGERFPDNSFG